MQAHEAVPFHLTRQVCVAPVSLMYAYGIAVTRPRTIVHTLATGDAQTFGQKTR